MCGSLGFKICLPLKGVRQRTSSRLPSPPAIAMEASTGQLAKRYRGHGGRDHADLKVDNTDSAMVSSSASSASCAPGAAFKGRPKPTQDRILGNYAINHTMLDGKKFAPIYISSYTDPDAVRKSAFSLCIGCCNAYRCTHCRNYHQGMC